MTSAGVLFPMLSPLIGGILDTLFGWELIFIFVVVVSASVLMGRGHAAGDTFARSRDQLTHPV